MRKKDSSIRSLFVKRLLGVVLFGSTITIWPLSGSGQAQNLPTSFLQLIEQSWYELSPQERSRALENYHRFQKLPPEKQHDIEERYNRWQQLPSEEQNRIRQNYQRYRGMNSDEKEEFSRKYKQWRSQPHE